MVDALRERDMLGLVVVKELVEGKLTVPTTKLTLNHFSSNKYSPCIGSDLADGQSQIIGKLTV